MQTYIIRNNKQKQKIKNIVLQKFCKGGFPMFQRFNILNEHLALLLHSEPHLSPASLFLRRIEWPLFHQLLPPTLRRFFSVLQTVLVIPIVQKSNGKLFSTLFSGLSWTLSLLRLNSPNTIYCISMNTGRFHAFILILSIMILNHLIFL